MVWLTWRHDFYCNASSTSESFTVSLILQSWIYTPRSEENHGRG